MNLAEPGKQRKVKKGRRSRDEDTGMFAFTFLTITSFPAAHDPMAINVVRIALTHEKSHFFIVLREESFFI